MAHLLAPEVDAERRSIYAAAPSLAAAARQLNLSVPSLRAWVKRRGLPMKQGRSGGPTGPRNRVSDGILMEAYVHEGSDRTAASRAGVTQTKFQAWRKRNDLPPKQLSFSDRIDQDEHLRRFRIYVKAVDMADFAEMTGLSISGAQQWVEAANLPPPAVNQRLVQAKKRFAKLRKPYRAAYEATATDLDAAAKLNVTLEEFRQWRTWEGLPPKAGKR